MSPTGAPGRAFPPSADAAPRELVPWLLRVTGGGGSSDAIDLVPADEMDERDDGTLTMTGRGRRFSATARWTRLGAEPRMWSVSLTVTLEAASASDPVDAALSIAVRLPADGDPDWLVPAVFYGENRPAGGDSRYPRWIPDQELDDVAVSDADRGDPFASREWWLRADRTAIPAVLATGGGLRVALATTEWSVVGPAGVGFGTVDAADGRGAQREIRLSFPYREEPVVYDGGAAAQPADRPTHRWRPGDTATLDFRIAVVAGGPRATAAILRALHGWLAAGSPLASTADAQALAVLAADGLLEWHDRSAGGLLIETAAFDRDAADPTNVVPGDRLAMHVAWLSGAPAAAALLSHGLRTGRSRSIAAARRVLDAIAANLAPCGTFWGQWTAADGWGKGWTPGPDALHVRTIGEATLFMVRAAALDPQHAPRWRSSVASNLAFVAARQRGDGAVPSSWNGRTGAALAWTGTAGLAWVPAFVEGARLLGDDRLLDCARALAGHHAADVEAGRLSGAPEDVHAGPTSEDGYVAVMAYVSLAAAATDRAERARWTELARVAADWMLSFRFSYNVTFPAGTLLDRIGFRTRGADLASPANQHLHGYGLICTRELLDLSRLTGDDHYRDRAREAYAAMAQGIARSDGDLGGARRGMAPERFFQTRYDGSKGEIGRLSHAWCLGLLLLAAEVAIEQPELVTEPISER